MQTSNRDGRPVYGREVYVQLPTAPRSGSGLHQFGMQVVRGVVGLYIATTDRHGDAAPGRRASGITVQRAAK
jgi:hypothetical protein